MEVKWMASPAPPLTIGLPVHNGARFVGTAIDSILAQTYKNFELIISDNASTDETEIICRSYVEKDNRVHYIRSGINIGAVRNFNHLLETSESLYFKWAAHDDVLAPEYLSRCIEILDRHPSVVVCHTETIYIDEHGKTLGTFDDQLDLCSPRPHERYKNYLFRPYPRCNAIFGVIRTKTLRQTPLFGSYLLSDRVLLGELSLRGKIHRVPEPLFLRRDHPHQAGKVNLTRESRQMWFDPILKEKITFPSWRLLAEHTRAVMRVPMNWYERLLCLKQLMTWIRQNGGKLVRDLLLLEE